MIEAAIAILGVSQAQAGQKLPQIQVARGERPKRGCRFKQDAEGLYRLDFNATELAQEKLDDKPFGELSEEEAVSLALKLFMQVPEAAFPERPPVPEPHNR
jgi:hypothetical protein